MKHANKTRMPAKTRANQNTKTKTPKPKQKGAPKNGTP
jgi:hypothetical protein